MIDVDYFALLLEKESKNKTLEIQIIVISEAHDDFDMNQDIIILKKFSFLLWNRNTQDLQSLGFYNFKSGWIWF